MLSHVFLPDRDAALEFDLDLRFPDDDLFDQRPHDGLIVCAHDTVFCLLYKDVAICLTAAKQSLS